MEVIIDKRIELMTVLQTINNYWDSLSVYLTHKNLFQCKYKEDIKSYFEKYKNHETIKLYNELSNNIQDIDTFLNLVLCYSNPPEFDNIASIENNLNGLLNLKFSNEIFINNLRQFYEDTNFEYFYEKNQVKYKKMITDFRNDIELSGINDTMDNYLGNEIKDYKIIISALFIGNFGIKIILNNKETLNYLLLSPYNYKGGKYIFGNSNFIKGLLWHEMGHLTINNLTGYYFNKII